MNKKYWALAYVLSILTFIFVYNKCEKKRIKAWYKAGLIDEFIQTL